MRPTRKSLARCLLLALSSFGTVSSVSGSLGKAKHVWEHRIEVENRKAGLLNQVDSASTPLYTAHILSTPVDHFHNISRYEPHSSRFYDVRYWFDASYYKPGGPVIIIQGGETDAAERLPLLHKGIAAQLAQATNGIGVILEHRYYGKSFPTENLSTENLRFLSTEQALADEAYFAQNIRFPGLERYGDLSSNTTAYIAYGGSYAGSFSAFLRLVYPHIFWGAISSSGVTKAIINYWHYFEAIAKYGPTACMETQKTLTHIVDTILIVKNFTDLPEQLKTVFGLQNVTHDADFASVLASALQHFQSMNWDPEINDGEFYNYCNNLTSFDVLYPETAKLRSTAAKLVVEGGYDAEERLVNSFLNFVGYVNLTEVSRCAAQSMTQDSCFGTFNKTFYQQASLDDYSWRSWPYQFCTEYGYLMTADVPVGELPIISRTMDLAYNSIICREAFNLTAPPDIETVNKFGAYDVTYPRLAMIGGEWDPWRPATPQAFEYGAKNRTSSVDEPFILMPAAVHHWDENGLLYNESTDSLPPPRVAQTQKAERDFVLAWMEEWKWTRSREASDTASGGTAQTMDMDTATKFRVQSP